MDRKKEGFMFLECVLLECVLLVSVTFDVCHKMCDLGSEKGSVDEEALRK